MINAVDLSDYILNGMQGERIREMGMVRWISPVLQRITSRECTWQVTFTNSGQSNKEDQNDPLSKFQVVAQENELQRNTLQCNNSGRTTMHLILMARDSLILQTTDHRLMSLIETMNSFHKLQITKM